MDVNYKYKVGDRVLCNGLIAIVERRDVIAGTERPMYSLVAEADDSLSCSVAESEVEPYNGEDIDQSDALGKAMLDSFHIQKAVGSITDKYFRDGNH